jgi:hypothetical protein
MPVITMGAMPLIAIGALTILILAIAVWASVSQESDASMIGEGGPDWGLEPYEQQEQYRKTG